MAENGYNNYNYADILYVSEVYDDSLASDMG